MIYFCIRSPIFPQSKKSPEDNQCKGSKKSKGKRLSIQNKYIQVITLFWHRCLCPCLSSRSIRILIWDGGTIPVGQAIWQWNIYIFTKQCELQRKDQNRRRTVVVLHTFSMMIQQASERTFSSVRNAFTTELGGEKICIDEEQQRVQVGRAWCTLYDSFLVTTCNRWLLVLLPLFSCYFTI
jgi:hypothetical protein